MTLRNRWLDELNLMTSPHSLRTFPCLDPHAAHIGLNLAVTMLADTSARTIAKLFRAIHRASHSRLAQHTFATHFAIKHGFLNKPLCCTDGSFNAVIAQP